MRLADLLAGALLTLAVSCSSDDGKPSGGSGASAGQGGTGGQSGSGGQVGGAAGSGGQAAGGGQAGSGGKPNAKCPGLNPAGCTTGSCPAGTKCDLGVCAPSSCTCPTGAWSCAKDCQGGICIGTDDCSAIATSLAQGLPTTGDCTALVRLRLPPCGWLPTILSAGPAPLPTKPRPGQ
jgi:hypothetical protein